MQTRSCRTAYRIVTNRRIGFDTMVLTSPGLIHSRIPSTSVRLTHHFDGQHAPGGDRERGTSRVLPGILLEGDRPFDRAWLLLARVQSCFGPDEWREVFRRSQAIDDSLHSTAIRRLAEVGTGHPQSRGLHALNTASRETVRAVAPSAPSRSRASSFAAAPAAEHVRRLPKLTREARDEIGRALAHAVMAVALTPRLEPTHVALLASPVLEPLRLVRF